MNFLENKTIRLRALEPEDIELLYQWENDTSLWTSGNTLAPYSRFALRQYMESQSEDLYTSKQLRLMVVWKENGKAVGTLDMFDFDPYHRRAGIGVLVETQYRSLGLASQSLALFIQYAFNFLKLKQLYCNIAEDNIDSLALFQKHGFEISGKLRSWHNGADGWKDVYMLQLINT